MSLNFNKEVSHRNSHSVHIVVFIAAVLCVLYTFNCVQSDGCIDIALCCIGGLGNRGVEKNT